MSAMDVERSLDTWLEQTEPSMVPADLLSRTFEVTRRTGQRGAYLARLGGGLAEVRARSRIQVSPAAAMAILLLLLALALGALLVGSRLFTRHTSWQALDQTQVEGAATWVTDMATSGPLLVAVGNTAVPAAGECGREMRGRVWASDGGGGWADRGGTTFVNARIEKVGHAGGRFYILATTDAACGQGGPPSYASWSSVDGVQWTSVPGAVALDGSFVGEVIEANGRLLAFGLYQEPSPPDGTGAAEARVWAVTDAGWTQLSTIDQVFVGQAAALGGTVLATAFDFEGSAKLFRSSDGGATWSETPVDLDQFSFVGATRQGFVVTGDQRVNEESKPAVLWSADGSVWTAGTPFADQVVGLWSTGAHLVAATMGPPLLGEDDCAEWTSGPRPTAYRSLEPGETPSSETAPPAPLASYCRRIREPGYQAWLSDDSVAWRQAAVLPERGRELPEITVPIPNSNYILTGMGDAVFVANPTFGQMVWFAPLSEFAPPDEQ